MKLKTLTLLLAMFAVFSVKAQDYNMELRSTMEFPDQTLANVCGYVQNGHEYALLGGQLGLIIVDITDPDNPVQIIQVPGPDNLWKEIKTFQHYCYVTTEGGPVQIIDLSPLPSSNLPVTIYNGDGPIAGEIGNVHALHIDETKGFLYLFGSGAGVNGTGGALVCDLNTDPLHPVFVGEYQSMGYVHDGFVDNDTLYAAHVYAGLMIMVDMTDKQSPKVLGSTLTPNNFTHNVWPTDDRQAVLTTDEQNGSYLAAYDVSDPTNISELDRFQCTPGSGSIPHNTHVVNDFAVTSWYTDGVSIVDASRPKNLVQVAYFDTYPEQSGGGFNGCWGVYPFFPSGNIIASNIPIAFQTGVGKMYVLTPNYKRACWLEGTVTNGLTGETLSGVTVIFNSPDPLTDVATGLLGDYATGQPTAGTFPVTFELNGFDSKTVIATLVNGQVTILDVQLYPPGTSSAQWLEENEASIKASPSIFASQTIIEVKMPAGGDLKGELRLTDLNGRLVWMQKIEGNQSRIVMDAKLPNGDYFLFLFIDGRQTKAMKLTKVD